MFALLVYGENDEQVVCECLLFLCMVKMMSKLCVSVCSSCVKMISKLCVSVCSTSVKMINASLVIC